MKIHLHWRQCFRNNDKKRYSIGLCCSCAYIITTQTLFIRFAALAVFPNKKKQRESNSEKYYVLFVHGKDIKIHINCYFSALNMAINLLKKKNVFLFLPAIGDIGGSACFKQQPRVTNKHETSRSLMMLWIASSSYSRRWIRKEIWELKKGPHTI